MLRLCFCAFPPHKSARTSRNMPSGSLVGERTCRTGTPGTDTEASTQAHATTHAARNINTKSFSGTQSRIRQQTTARRKRNRRDFHLFLCSRKKHKACCKKHKPYILKYKAHISKYMPYIFREKSHLIFNDLQKP